MYNDHGKMILHLAYTMVNQQQKMNVELIRQHFTNKECIPEEEIERLIQAGYLLREKDDSFKLTDSGRIEAAKASEKAIQSEFSEKIDRLTRSSAYLDYCEEVYGYRAYLFNMMDKQQIDFVLSSIPVSANDTVLDLGCGSGSILNRMVKKYGCRGIGMDQINEDIVKRNSPLITYIKDDMNRFANHGIKPTVTLSIDSLYFISDLNKLIQALNSIENNKMYLFYSQYLFNGESGDGNSLQSNNTVVAGILNQNGIPFRTINYSENERLLYENSLKVLKKFERAFEEEGNRDLYENKLKEDAFGMELYNNKLASRYLYIIS